MGSFIKDTKGNMAMMFAGALFMIIIGAGAAIDMSAIEGKKLKYQGYADAAVLAAITSGETNLVNLNAIATSTVNGNDTTDQQIQTQLTILQDGTLHVDVTVQHEMMLMGIFGNNFQNIKVVAEAPPPGKVRLLNIALVLDVTESMEGAKLTALKAAAASLVDSISGGQNGDTMFSVVPFAQYVKIPMKFETEDWLNPEPAGNSCYDELDLVNSLNCQVIGSGEGSYTECGTTVYKQVCAWEVWDGCVASRVTPWHKREQASSASQIQGFTRSDWCHSEMLPLTKDIATVKTVINGLSTAQDTYIPAGLIWGWRALTPGAPLTEADTPDQGNRTQAILLMSDGENTRSLGGNSVYGYEGVYHWSQNQADADGLTTELCQSIKADGILIFTIAFEVTDAATINLLRNCASEPNKFFDATNAVELQASFADVGNGLSNGIRLSK